MHLQVFFATLPVKVPPMPQVLSHGTSVPQSLPVKPKPHAQPQFPLATDPVPLPPFRHFKVHGTCTPHVSPCHPVGHGWHVQLPLATVPLSFPPFWHSSEHASFSSHFLPLNPSAQLHPQSPPLTDPFTEPPFKQAEHGVCLPHVSYSKPVRHLHL